MKQPFFVLLVLVALALGGAQAAAAQQTTNETDSMIGVEVVNNSAAECTETIDNLTTVCSSSVDSDGMMTLVLYSDMYQEVTLADGGAFRRGGQVPTRDFRLQEGRNRIQWQLVNYKGYTVSIGTQNALYAEHITRQQAFLPGSPQPEDPAIAALTMFGMFAVAFPVSYIGLQRFRGGVRDEL
ncbi:hypothetical protein SAMN05216559_0134 [Halomicrobium zhouii]|uniref:Uncharacterized protein n=1 Tax=Halomicrobium zhouii TaxID=767519 RepID=A0A1I6K3N2_9EURY|nr:hypothetical protein [Halomicrobium zhouii]SFR85774.1 hypothetical protein SAMN05216559_0134 [Halomicrobium zhouii]